MAVSEIGLILFSMELGGDCLGIGVTCSKANVLRIKFGILSGPGDFLGFKKRRDL